MENKGESKLRMEEAAALRPEFAVGAPMAMGLEQTQIGMFHLKGGTGFAAEDANALNDVLHGRDVECVGRSCTLNGADRVVDGVQIQTKYFDSATRTVNAAFDKDGNYRYSGQRLEVPADQYDACLERMRVKIRAGKVPGVTDPNDAEKIVHKGSVTYRQARNIARAGTVDGLKYDAKTHAVGATMACGLSFLIHFSHLKWNGVHTRQALLEATLSGLGTGTLAFSAGIATSQVLRTRAAAIGTVLARDVVKKLHSTGLGKTVIEKIAAVSLKRAAYGGAAINHVSKLLRSNVVTSVVVTTVMTAPDLYRATFAKNISWSQFSKNLAVNGVGIAAGAGGWMAGAAAGAAAGSVVPIVGTVAGGVLGGLIGSLGGGTLASFGTKKVLDRFVEDDAVALFPLIQEQLSELASDYMLREDEVASLIEVIQTKIRGGFLRDLYASKNRNKLILETFEPKCEALMQARPRIVPPTAEEIDVAVAEIIEQALDGADELEATQQQETVTASSAI